MRNFLCGLAKTVHLVDICALLWKGFVVFCFLWLSCGLVFLIVNI